jgi:hypothetical protein
VQGVVTDETRLEYVTVDVINTSGSRVLQAYNFSPNDMRQEIDVTLSHDDLYLPSGTYNVKITATDGENTQMAFQEIQLVEAPRILERIFLIRAGNTTTAIDSLNNGAAVPWVSYEGVAAFGGIDSRNNQLVISNTEPSAMSSLRFPDLEPIIAPLPFEENPLTAFYHDMERNQFIWGNTNGQLMLTDLTGSRLFSYIYASNRIKLITATALHIIAISESTITGSNYIHVYPRSSGMPVIELPVNWEINGALPLRSDEHFIILGGNNTGEGHFAYLNLNTGAINENFNFYDQSSVESLCAGAGDDFYAIQSSGIVRYSNNFASYSVNNTIHPDKLIYDDLNNAVWAIEASGIHQFDEVLITETAQFPISGVTDLWLKYNK